MFFVVLLLFSAFVHAEICNVPTGGNVINATPAQVNDVVALLKGQAAGINGGKPLQPGDELHLAGGTYTLNSRVAVTLTGTADKYIVIRSKEGEKAIINRPRDNENILDISVAYTYWYDIEMSGGSAGLRLEKDCHHNTFDKLEIHGSKHVIFRANSSGSKYYNNLIQNCHLHDPLGPGTMEVMYLGCNNNACQFYDNVITGNHIHGTEKPGVTQGDGIEIKRGSYGNEVSDNVIYDTHYPGIFVYGWPGKANNRVLRNLIFNTGDHCMQVTSNADIIGNIMAGCGGSGIAVQPNQGNPEAINIEFNTIDDIIALRGTSNGDYLIRGNIASGQIACFGGACGAGVKFENNFSVQTASTGVKKVPKDDLFKAGLPTGTKVNFVDGNYLPGDAAKFDFDVQTIDVQCTMGLAKFAGAYQSQTITQPLAKTFKTKCTAACASGSSPTSKSPTTTGATSKAPSTGATPATNKVSSTTNKVSSTAAPSGTVAPPTLYKPNPDCPRGKATCLCKDGACEAGLQCVVSGGDAICLPASTCTAGQPGCKCTDAGTCDAPSVCSSNLCAIPVESCPQGDVSCKCNNDGTCANQETLECDLRRALCVFKLNCEPGDKGCDCIEDQCNNAGLVCASFNDQHICVDKPVVAPDASFGNVISPLIVLTLSFIKLFI